MASAVITAFEITWDPGLRGILVVAVGVAVLVGSIYAILATNLGARLGFLISVAGLAAWLALMGFVWTIYGIGYKGTAAHWVVEEVVTSEAQDDLEGARLEKAHDLSTWRKLAADDPARGEATATATAAIIGEDSAVHLFESATSFEVLDAYDVGGKKKNWFNNWVPGPHPPHYSIIQVQALLPPEEGETASTELDNSAPVHSVIMVRDLGKLRVPAFLTTMASLIVFGIACNALHRRDKAVMAARAAAGV